MDYQFDIDQWLPLFPLTPTIAGVFHGVPITGPSHVCNNEQLRRQLQQEYDWGPAVPMDVFVMADGEAPERSMTKIGGIPYRSATKPWPSDRYGRPMLFLAQFNFSYSKDLVGELPGDLLLIFVDGLEEGIRSVHMEWQSLDVNPVARLNEIPPHPDAFNPCFGYRFRTTSYPDAQPLVSTDEVIYPKCQGLDVWSDHWLPQYQATQIGRAPFFIQPGEGPLTGKAICTVSAVMPETYEPYRWINHPEPIKTARKCLELDDTGCVYISIDENQKLHWRFSCF